MTLQGPLGKKEGRSDGRGSTRSGVRHLDGRTRRGKLVPQPASATPEPRPSMDLGSHYVLSNEPARPLFALQLHHISEEYCRERHLIQGENQTPRSLHLRQILQFASYIML